MMPTCVQCGEEYHRRHHCETKEPLGFNYKIIRAKSADRLVQFVNNAMEAGFLPQGGVCMAQVTDSDISSSVMVYEYFQAMVWRSDE